MARRKRELLDILRNRSDGDGASKKPSTRHTAPAPSQSEPSSRSASKSESSRTHRLSTMSSAPAKGKSWSTLIWVSLALAVVVLLGLKYWPQGPAEANSDDNAVPAEQLSSEPYAVLVAKYAFSPTNRALAIQSGRALRAKFPELDSTVVLTKFPPEDPEIYELWIGKSEDSDELKELLRQVQEATIEDLPQNPRPFASAYIEQRRPIASNWIMSIHKSLSLGSNLNSSRSVYTRRERLAKLTESGDFQEGDSVYGLRKVRTQYKTLSKKQLKALAAADKLKADEQAAAVAAAAAEEEELWADHPFT